MAEFNSCANLLNKEKIEVAEEAYRHTLNTSKDPFETMLGMQKALQEALYIKKISIFLGSLLLKDTKKRPKRNNIVTIICIIFLFLNFTDIDDITNPTIHANETGIIGNRNIAKNDTK